MRSALLALVGLSWVAGCTEDGKETDASASADATATASDDVGELGCAADIPHDTTDGASNPVMETWGAPCTSDAECVALIGEGAVCQTMAVIYELPGGYCSKPCSLPDDATRVVMDDPQCDPAGGVACIGAKGYFESCAVICTDDMQCNRDGYTCQPMPMISQEGDPSFCLMPECCIDTCAED